MGVKHRSGEFTWHKHHSFIKLLGIILYQATDAENPKQNCKSGEIIQLFITSVDTKMSGWEMTQCDEERSPLSGQVL